MTRRSAWLLIGGIAVAAAILALWQREPAKPSARVETAISTAPESKDASVAKVPDAPPAIIVETTPIIDPETDQPLIPPLPLQTGELPWEARIRTILTREKATDTEKAIELFRLLPTIPAEGAETCAEEAVKRLPNAEYRHAQAAVSNPGTYGLALGILFADLMERPDHWRLPTLAAIARNSAHPYASPARDNLQLLLGQDLGEDWNRWETAVREKLKTEK